MGDFSMHASCSATTAVEAKESHGCLWLSIINDRDELTIFFPRDTPIQKLQQVATALGECFALPAFSITDKEAA